MKTLKNLLAVALSKKKLSDERKKLDATALKLRNVMQQCPICENGFSNHAYSSFASTILGEAEKPNVIEFFKALKEHRWQDVKKFKEWEATRDNAEVYLVRCLNNQIALLVVRSPEEFYESDSLIAYEALDLEQSQLLDNLIKHEEWKSLQD